MKRKNIIIVLGLLVITTLILTACSQATTQSDDPLEGTNWQLVFYRKTRVIEGTSISAKFENGEITGSAGCNSFFGSYEIDEANIMISTLGATEMFCMEPDGVMEQEAFYLESLQDAQRYEILDGRLTIFRSDHETLTFDPFE